MAVTTNEIFRGQSTSGDDPAAALAVSYDHPSGLFAGGSLSLAVDGDGPRLASSTQYAGYAIRRGKTSLEVGAVHRDYRRVYDRAYHPDYVEFFAGVTRRRTNIRLFASPDYSRRGGTNFYGEINTALVDVEKWSVNGHLGLSFLPRHGGGYSSLRAHPDWKVDASRAVGPFFLAVGAAGTSYPVTAPTGQTRLFASVSRAF